MKIHHSFISLAILSVVFASCNRTDDQTNPQPQVQARNGFVSFRIDNVTWEAPATISQMGMLTAYRGSEILQIQLPSNSPGTYNISASTSPSVRLSQYAGQDYDSYACSPAGGRVVITSNDGALTGNFTAKVCMSGGQSKEILNGVFTRIPVQ